MSDLLSLDAALSIIARVVEPVSGHVSRPLADALHGVTARPVHARYALPPFTNTGVDGYAFRHDGNDQTIFDIIGASFAGQPFNGLELQAGQAARIATGAVLPRGADTVVMQEHVRVDEGRLVIVTPPPRGTNIRHAGADIAQDAEVFPAGHRLRAQDIALLGALGNSTVPVRRRLRIAIASTGLELVGPDIKLEPGQIVDTNSLMLRNLLCADDADITLIDPLPDDYDATRAVLQSEADNHDVIITTGGVSVGDRDYVRHVLHDIGTVHFWKLAIRPGKPVLLGQIGGCLTACLPGNPVSAFVTFLLIVRPVLAALRGGNAVLPPAYNLPLAGDLKKDTALRSFPRARLVQERGTWLARPYRDQSSNLFTSLTDADGILDLPAEAKSYAAGDMVAFRPFSGLV